MSTNKFVFRTLVSNDIFADANNVNIKTYWDVYRLLDIWLIDSSFLGLKDSQNIFVLQIDEVKKEHATIYRQI